MRNINEDATIVLGQKSEGGREGLRGKGGEERSWRKMEFYWLVMKEGGGGE